MMQTVDKISVLHIDRNQLFREGLRRILNDSAFLVEGETSSLEDGLDQISALAPRLIIIDPVGCSSALADLTACTHSLSPEPRVVVLTESVAMPRLTNALTAGVDGYLLKNMSTDALKQSLLLVLAGETVFPTDLAHLLINDRFIAFGNSGRNGRNGRNGTLSERETEILSCLVNGRSNKMIANHLDITEGTVKVHLKGILRKINVTNRTQAAIWAVQHGIVADAASE